MEIYILVFIFNFFFNIFKTLEIKYTYEHKVRALLANSVWINLVSLGSTYFAIDRLFNGDWVVLIFFIGGSVTGKYVAMTKIHIFKRRLHRFYIKMKNKK